MPVAATIRKQPILHSAMEMSRLASLPLTGWYLQSLGRGSLAQRPDGDSEQGQPLPAAAASEAESKDADAPSAPAAKRP